MRAVLLLLLAATSIRADITATVTIAGTPNSQDETFIASAANCGEGSKRHTENWKIGKKGELADVVVWIADAKLAPNVPAPAVPELSQIGCTYVPHVLAVTAGVPFKVLNGDPTLHNVLARSYTGPTDPPGATVFNLGQSYRGQIDQKQFDDPGIYTVVCNVHSWMQAWIRALPNPCYAVTGADGKATIQLSGHLQDGTYKIEAWHPRFADTLEQTVTVKNGTATVAFQFQGSKSL